LAKIRGKQIKRSRETDNLAHARRELKDFRRDQEKVDPFGGRSRPAIFVIGSSI